MSDNEILDSVDRDGNVIGQHTRKEFHSNPQLIHQVAHAWILNENGQVLMQQRSLTKDSAPGKWDMSCGGHISSGDDAEATIIRELKEELGITDANMHFVGTQIYKDERQSELIYLFFIPFPNTDFDFKLQKEEVEQVAWLNIDQAMLEIVKGERAGTMSIFDELPKILQYILKGNFSKYL